MNKINFNCNIIDCKLMNLSDTEHQINLVKIILGARVYATDFPTGEIVQKFKDG